MASSMNDIILAYACLFNDSTELQMWAQEMGISHFPEIEKRIYDLKYMEEEEMEVDDFDKVVENHLLTFNREDRLMKWCRENNLSDNDLVEKRRKELLHKQFKCSICSKSYVKNSLLKTHIESVHEKKTYKCWKCDKQFFYNSNKTRHEKTCTGKSIVLRTFECHTCKARFPTRQQLQNHARFHMLEGNRQNSSVPQPGTSFQRNEHSSEQSNANQFHTRGFTCRTCNSFFKNRKELCIHQMQHIQQGGGLKTQPEPWTENEAPWFRSGGEIDHRLKEIYEANRPIILEENQEGMVISQYNLPLNNNFSINDLLSATEEITKQQQQAFRINFSFGIILRNNETGEYRYFRPYGNESLFQQPLLISQRKDVNSKLRLRLEKMEVTEYVLKQRKDSKWKPVMITNARIVVFRTNFPLGAGKTQLPDYIIRKPCIIGLTAGKSGRPYEDNLCAFRCLASHRNVPKMEMSVTEYYREWVIYMKENDMGDFTSVEKQNYTGIHLKDIAEFERCFKININIYSFDEDEIAKTVFTTTSRFPETMNLNLYEAHLSYIKDMKAYSSKYTCEHCEKCFKTSSRCLRHRRTCSSKTTFVFPGKFYKLHDTLFDKLKEVNIHVQKEKQHFPWFIVCDFEAMLQSVNENQVTSKLTWTKIHIPISVSVCSNVPGFTEPQCFINSNTDKLLIDMIKYMNDIAVKVNDLAEEHWSSSISELHKFLACEDNKMMINLYKQLLEKMEDYCQQTPVLGFNSSRYDLNLIKQKLARHLSLHDKTEKAFTVKQGNAYTCISNKRLKFLDISNYLAPGSSYAKFLAAYGVEEQKGYFPYEWFDSEEKLKQTSLPPHENFFSALKNRNISNKEYAYCQKIWKEKEMKTFRDFLVWYNNLDVQPFTTAVQKLQQFYFEKGIDIFKVCMSVPGVARRMLFEAGSKSGAHFSLFHKDDADLFHCIQNNIIGGPSIIFTRHCEANKTLIRDNKEKLCKRIVGFDANALYLWAIDQRMPVGPYVRRRKENQFRSECRDKYMSAFHWLDWLSKQQGKAILHKLNNGNEKRIGPFPVDGYSPDRRIVYQFHGCYFHGHKCWNTKNIKNVDWLASCEKKFEKTKETTKYIRKKGYEVVEIWECEFIKLKRESFDLREFIRSRQPSFQRKHYGSVTGKEILQAIQQGELFGMVEVDISVPDHWTKPEHQHISRPPKDYFSEMSPIFCTTEVPFEAIGAHMQEHVESFNLSKKPRKLLLGGLSAEKILLATPLLKWYLDHGLEVTNIYQLVEFSSSACFHSFVTDVSNARRRGDVDPQQAIIAETSKLIGNSSYGGLIMDKTKHRNIFYVSGEINACAAVNEPRFRDLTCLDEGVQYYEVEMAKRKITNDLPIQLGYFILQYAKLRMLEFYYDFMDKFVDRSNFEYCEMDTDSAYMALSQKDLLSVIKPEMKEKYLSDLNDYCVDNVPSGTKMWFPRNCCDRHRTYDKRTPGLFKLEYEGDEMIGLCSKTYIVRKNDEYKFSSKGLTKSTVTEPFKKFQDVLKTQQSESGVNNGFRTRNNTIFSYNQERCGLTYFYCKRRVLEDGIHTQPLDIVLKPIEKYKTENEEVDDEELVQILTDLMDE